MRSICVLTVIVCGMKYRTRYRPRVVARGREYSSHSRTLAIENSKPTTAEKWGRSTIKNHDCEDSDAKRECLLFVVRNIVPGMSLYVFASHALNPIAGAISQ
jgi:hypothetical protein